MTFNLESMGSIDLGLIEGQILAKQLSERG